MQEFLPAVEAIRAALPGVQAIYLFGSRAKGVAGPTSDTDLAVLAGEPIEEFTLFSVASRLSELLRTEVDLVDLRRSSAVMRVQVLGSSRLLLDTAPSARMAFEAFALADYARLNEERRCILDDVRTRGTIHG